MGKERNIKIDGKWFFGSKRGEKILKSVWKLLLYQIFPFREVNLSLVVPSLSKEDEFSITKQIVHHFSSIFIWNAKNLNFFFKLSFYQPDSIQLKSRSFLGKTDSQSNLFRRFFQF